MAVVRALAIHQCGPGSTPGPGVICGLSLLLVVVLAPRGFSPGTSTFLNSNSTWTQWTKRHLVDVPLLIPIYLIFFYLYCSSMVTTRRSTGYGSVIALKKKSESLTRTRSCTRSPIMVPNIARWGTGTCRGLPS